LRARKENRFCDGRGSGKLPAPVVRLFILKPDGIGDFILVTGALRLLASERGEENLLICVRPVIVPLAKAQFPNARVIELPTAAERKTVNLFARNLFYCLPLWFKLRMTPVDAAVCFRSMRNYLETFLFYSANTKCFFGCENILLRSRGKKVRSYVDSAVRKLFHPRLMPYPEEARHLPLEVEAHRRVVAEILERSIGPEEVIPRLHSAAEPTQAGVWICAPITEASKVYPLPLWRDIFTELKPELSGKAVLLVGSKDQCGALGELESLLRSAGIENAKIHLPEDLVELLDLIAAAELVMTVDTAAAHFAAGLDRPCVILFSGLHQGMFAPWQRSTRQRWLLPDPPKEKTKSKWHAGIQPARVAATVRELVEFPSQPPRSAHTSCPG
jgi:ADP-heptose:LPS heptosyltransferase